MLKSFVKIHRTSVPILRQRFSLYEAPVKYSIFNFFKKKESNLPQKEEEDDEEKVLEELKAQKKQAEEDDKFIDKKQYYEKLKKEREEYEAKNEKMKREFEFEEQRDRRQYEINIAQIDYSRIAQENINLAVTAEFKHLEELFYFISNLRVRLSEENIKKCLEGFLSLAERINSNDLDKPQYFEFIEILKSNIMIIANNETLLLMLRFADLYIVDDPNLWQLLERKIFQKFQNFSQHELVDCIIHFANQNEGSDQFYDQFEKVITPLISNLEIRQLVILAQSYYQVRRGTKQFFDSLHKEMMSKVNEASTSDLIRLSIVYSAVDLKDKFNAFDKIEKRVIQHLNEYNIPELCIIAESFGLDNGSADFFIALEKRVLEQLDNLEYDQIEMVLRGFLYSYRGSKTIFGALKNRLISFFPKMDLKTLAQIAKAYHITENDDKQFESIMEKHVIINLRKLDQLNAEDIFEVASSYNITRIGSRELYKLLEFIIREKMDDIAKKPEIARGLYYLYTTSGLCSPELLKKLQYIV